MKRVGTFAAGGQVPSATLNGMQDRASSVLPANVNNDLSTFVGGDDGLHWQATANLGNGALIQLDSGDWHDRYITGECYLSQVSTGRIGAANDYGLDALAAGGTIFFRISGYLGKGARSNITTGALVSAGVPPVRGSGAFTSWVVNAGATDLAFCIFTDPSTGALYAYNNTAGATIYPVLFLRAFGVSGKRP